MNSNPLSLPEKKGYDQAYELAYTLARDKLKNTDNITEQCRKSDTQYQKLDSQEVLIVCYLNQFYSITFPDIEIMLNNSSTIVPIRDRLLILHYLNTAKGTSISEKVITFHELPEGAIYFPTFSKRTLTPLANHFGKNVELLMKTGEKLGGQKLNYGDAGLKILAFPRIPITIVIWKGDTEFPASGNILFDTTITDYLPTEDIIVLCETITWKLIRMTE